MAFNPFSGGGLDFDPAEELQRRAVLGRMVPPAPAAPAPAAPAAPTVWTPDSSRAAYTQAGQRASAGLPPAPYTPPPAAPPALPSIPGPVQFGGAGQNTGVTGGSGYRWGRGGADLGQQGFPGTPGTTVPDRWDASNPYKASEDAWLNWQGRSGLSGGGSGITRDALPGIIDRFNRETGGKARLVPSPSGDMVDFGDGRGRVDVLTAGGKLWYDEGKWGQTPGGASFGQSSRQLGGGPGAGMPPPPGKPPGGPSGQGGIGGPGGDLQSRLREELMRQMGLAGAPLDENALGIRQPFEAAQAAATRAQDRERTAMTERLYAQGGGSVDQATLNRGIQQSAESNAMGLAGLKSGLIGNEIQSRRQQTSQALQLANAIGARDESNKLQRELAQLDEQFRRAQLGQQESQFGRSMGFEQGQWNDRYGLDRQRMIDEANYRAMMAGLGQG